MSKRINTKTFVLESHWLIKEKIIKLIILIYKMFLKTGLKITGGLFALNALKIFSKQKVFLEEEKQL